MVILCIITLPKYEPYAQKVLLCMKVYLIKKLYRLLITLHMTNALKIQANKSTF